MDAPGMVDRRQREDQHDQPTQQQPSHDSDNVHLSHEHQPDEGQHQDLAGLERHPASFLLASLRLVIPRRCLLAHGATSPKTAVT